MVIENASSLFSFLETYNPADRSQLETLEEMVKKHPHFHLIKPYYLKSNEELHPDQYDQVLSQTAISTYDRQLLYEFLEERKTNLNEVIEKREESEKVTLKEEKPIEKKNIKKTTSPVKVAPKIEDPHPNELPFAEWASYLRANRIPKESSKIEEKFKLFDSFLEKKRTLKPSQEKETKDDLSAKSLASTDELMTETLAKVFVKQKKFENALQAYQILSLKYPEKNSFFADQIKEIKRLQKLKE